MAINWDVFRTQRFVVSGPFDEEMPNYYVVISNIKWWLENESEIYKWMDTNLSRGRLHHTGMIVEFENQKDCSTFLLKWGG